MKIYLSGPMTGMPHYNVPYFNSAAKYLRAAGFEVTNPVDTDSPELAAAAEQSLDGADEYVDSQHPSVLGDDVVDLLIGGHDAIVILAEGFQSRGCLTELVAARMAGIPAFFLTTTFSTMPESSRDEPIVTLGSGLVYIPDSWLVRFIAAGLFAVTDRCPVDVANLIETLNTVPGVDKGTVEVDIREAA